MRRVRKATLLTGGGRGPDCPHLPSRPVLSGPLPHGQHGEGAKTAATSAQHSQERWVLHRATHSGLEILISITITFLNTKSSSSNELTIRCII